MVSRSSALDAAGAGLGVHARRGRSAGISRVRAAVSDAAIIGMPRLRLRRCVPPGDVYARGAMPRTEGSRPQCVDGRPTSKSRTRPTRRDDGSRAMSALGRPGGAHATPVRLSLNAAE
jgi:hypothetical protein